MALRATAIFLCAAAAFAQQPKIVQPGAPGKKGKVISPNSLKRPPAKPADADVAFMQGMIHHHSQAVEMVELLRTRGESPALKAFGERIAISQTDEINSMKQWLTDRGKPLMPGMEHMDHNMAGMNHAMPAMPLMPGMLTPEQMKELAAARGAAFDKLFLTGMIQHHGGALTMVDDLFRVPGAGQDSVLYDFASDVENTQTAEIGIMRGMLKEKP